MKEKETCPFCGTVNLTYGKKAVKCMVCSRIIKVKEDPVLEEKPKLLDIEVVEEEIFTRLDTDKE